MVLSQEEIDGCREAFLAFDKDRSGTIDVWELRQVLEAMGQKPTEEELFQMISEVDENMSGNIDFAEFLKVIENQKERAENFDDESDMVDAFVACGGDPDKEGHVTRDTLIKIIKVRSIGQATSLGYHHVKQSNIFFILVQLMISPFALLPSVITISFIIRNSYCFLLFVLHSWLPYQSIRYSYSSLY